MSAQAPGQAPPGEAASPEFLVPPEPVRRSEVTSADGQRLHLEIHGPQDSGAPTVVLIHGWTCSVAFWAPVIHALRDELRVVAYDLRGHGRSDPPAPGGYRVEALADDLEAVLDHVLRPGEQAVLAGHSMGGMAIMAAAPRESVLNRTGGVLLASTGSADLVTEALAVPFAAVMPAMVTLQHWLLTSAAPLTPFSHLSQSLLSYLTLGPGASAELAAANTAIIEACDPRARAAWGRVLTSLDVTAGVRQLDVPAHVLVGTADRLTPPGHARRVARLLPQLAGLTELPGIGHMTPLEAPGVVAGLIRQLAASAG